MKTNVVFSVLVVVLLSVSQAMPMRACAAEQESQPVLRAGAAVADITPPLGETIVGGFEPFPATAIHDKLFARCLVLDNGQTQIGFVICDNLGIPRQVFDLARVKIAEQTDLLPGNILMAATHTHDRVY